MLVFSESFPFYQCLASKLGTRIALNVREVGGLEICTMEDQFFVFVPEIAANEPQYSVGRFAAFLCLFLPLEVFGDDDSLIALLICCQQLLIGHVIVVLLKNLVESSGPENWSLINNICYIFRFAFQYRYNHYVQNDPR